MKLSLDERGIAGLYLMAFRLGSADGRAQDALAGLLRLCFLNGVRVGLTTPGDAATVEQEIEALMMRLRRIVGRKPEARHGR